METFLRKLYHGCGMAGAACIFVIAFSVVAEIVVRLFGMSLPGVIEIATFGLVGASFLALAHTFRHNVHIRITVVTVRMPAKIRRWFEMFSLVVAAAVAFWLAFYGATMAWDAYSFNDRSDGLLSIPLWIPQLMMTWGVLLLAISIVEEFIKLLRGREPIYETRARITQETEDADEPVPHNVSGRE